MAIQHTRPMVHLILVMEIQCTAPTELHIPNTAIRYTLPMGRLILVMEIQHTDLMGRLILVMEIQHTDLMEHLARNMETQHTVTRFVGWAYLPNNKN